MDERTIDAVLEAQRGYYQARAPEYDQWWERRGRYDGGAACNARWFAEVGTLTQWVATHLAGADDVLEIAGGTGNFTKHLARLAKRVTVLDAAPAMMAIARERLERAGLADRVTHRLADVFEWQPTEREDGRYDEQYDAVFFSFWLSHVPAARRAAFIDKVARSLRPGGVVAVIDSRVASASSAIDAAPRSACAPAHSDEGDGRELQLRRLNDGRRYEIVKRYDAPEMLERELTSGGLTAHAGATETYFVYCLGRAPP